MFKGKHGHHLMPKGTKPNISHDIMPLLDLDRIKALGGTIIGRDVAWDDYVIDRVYREVGANIISRHRDNEFGDSGIILGNSFGAPRVMRFTQYRMSPARGGCFEGAKKYYDITLPSGSVYVMRGSTNRDWTHQVLKHTSGGASKEGHRYSFTIRERDATLKLCDRAFGILEPFEMGRRDPQYRKALYEAGVRRCDDLISILKLTDDDVRLMKLKDCLTDFSFYGKWGEKITITEKKVRNLVGIARSDSGNERVLT